MNTSLRTLPRAFSRHQLIPKSTSFRSRSYASHPQYTPPPNTSGRTIALVALAVGGAAGGAYYLSQQGRGMLVQLLPPYGLNKHPSESVLAQKSLKEPGMHSSDGPSKAAKSIGAAAAKKVEDHSSISATTPPQTPSAVTDPAAKVSNPQEGAFNEETGEINWDCPCLGGMADGPCGEQFKAAFSCFVFSEAEPKGMDCVDKFKNMQDCFREHPDIYGEEIEDDDEEDSIQPNSTHSEPPAHPIPGNPVGDTRTPRQRAEGPPGKPTETPPENSKVFTATPDNSPKKGPKHMEKAAGNTGY